MHNMTVYHPFAQSSLDELFRGFFRPVARRKDGRPDPDGRRGNGERLRRQGRNPGRAKDDIQVSIEGSEVTIGAEVKAESETKDGQRVVRSERYSGSVYRAFTLPVEIDEAASNAKYENGVLELTLSKKPAAAGRKLTIQ
jgi:HSP20 family protein